MRMSNGHGNGNAAPEPGAEFKKMIKSALEKKSSEKSPVEKVNTAIGVVFSILVTSFGLPFLIVFAYNGLQPAVWPDISYLPTVAALAVFRILIHMIRKE